MSLHTQGLMTREDMLRELELLPVWQLRAPLSLPSAQLKLQCSPVEQAPEHLPVATKLVNIQVLKGLESLDLNSLRLLVSKDSTFAFLLATTKDDAISEQVETLLQNMLKAMQVSCQTDLAEACLQHLTEHPPKLIIAMGEVSANTLLDKTHSIAEWRDLQLGNQEKYEATPVVVTYHPAHLLKNLADKASAWQDLCFAKSIVQNL